MGRGKKRTKDPMRKATFPRRKGTLSPQSFFFSWVGLGSLLFASSSDEDDAGCCGTAAAGAATEGDGIGKGADNK